MLWGTSHRWILRGSERDPTPSSLLRAAGGITCGPGRVLQRVHRRNHPRLSSQERWLAHRRRYGLLCGQCGITALRALQRLRRLRLRCLVPRIRNAAHGKKNTGRGGQGLSDRGHRVELWPDWAWKAGGVCLITIDREQGVLTGAPTRAANPTPLAGKEDFSKHCETQTDGPGSSTDERYFTATFLLAYFYYYGKIPLWKRVRFYVSNTTVYRSQDSVFISWSSTH